VRGQGKYQEEAQLAVKFIVEDLDDGIDRGMK
jgi:hypothetical protein